MKFEEFQKRVERAGGVAISYENEMRHSLMWEVIKLSEDPYHPRITMATCKPIVGVDDSASVEMFFTSGIPALVTLRNFLLICDLDPASEEPAAAKIPVEHPGRCENCKFFDGHRFTEQLGYCRRRAPTISNGVGFGTLEPLPFTHPIVRFRDWCGEYEAKP